MSWVHSAVRTGVALVLVLAAHTPTVAAQSATGHLLRNKSVHGTLERVDPKLNSLHMKTTAGERMAWQLDAAVIAELAKFKAGDAVVVIYRQIGPTDKAVTAIGFPGATATPIYVNTTKSRVLFRSGDAVDGQCGLEAGTATETTLLPGAMAEISDACWCCTPAGTTCTPANKSGLGRAFLVACFK